jgi:hypothetical protein
MNNLTNASRGLVNGQFDALALQDQAADAEVASVARLAALPGVIAEVVLSDEDAAAMAAALTGGDLAEVGRLFAAARDRYVAELIEDRQNRAPYSETDGESADYLATVYA